MRDYMHGVESEMEKVKNLPGAWTIFQKSSQTGQYKISL